MGDGQALLRAVLDDPADDTRRLVYADWLEESGDTERAEFIRVQVDLRQMDEEGSGVIDPYEGHTCHEDPCPVCAAVDRHSGLQHRERAALLTMLPRQPQWLHLPIFAGGIGIDMDHPAGLALVGTDAGEAVLRRGFVAEVRCPLQVWLDHGHAVMRAHPVERVEVSDRQPLYYTGRIRRVYAWAGGEGAPHLLPAALLWALDWDSVLPSDHAHGYQGWETEAEAIDALSAACLSWARDGQGAAT